MIATMITAATTTAVVIGVKMSGGNHAADSTTSSYTFAMFNPDASEADVLASIRRDFCSSEISVYPPQPDGGTQVTCRGPNTATDADSGGIFMVYPTQSALHAALSAGTDRCVPTSSMSSGTAYLLIGPRWSVTTFSSADQSALTSQGAATGACN